MLKKALAVMERVQQHEQNLNRKLFDHTSFQGYKGEWYTPYETLIPPAQTEEELLNSCGTTCCFVGWLAIAPEFWHLNLIFTRTGYFENYLPHQVDTILKAELGLDEDNYRGLVYNEKQDDGHRYFGKPSSEVTVQDVIDKLKGLIGK